MAAGRNVVRVFVVALVALLGLGLGTRALARSRTMVLFTTPITRVSTRDSVVALTFDDGPVPALADSIMRVLAARGAKATFFMIGHELASAPDVGRRLLAEGHELGNHTYTHRRMVLVTEGILRAEIDRTDSLLRAIGAGGTPLMRPPYGYKLVGLPRYLARTGRTMALWDIEPDSYPEVAATSDGIVRHVLDRVRPGSVILLHPWYPNRRTSLEAIGPLLDSLAARGYRVTSLRDARP
jgi:peptidoglycan-N-acetylglucosamine deacetylase